MKIKEIRRKIISMILPITIENILQMTAGLISMAMIGRIDEISISAIGISNRIIQFIWALFKGIATGVTILVAQYFGAKNTEKLNKTILQGIISSILLSLLFFILVFFNSKALLLIFNPKPTLLSSANLYLKITSFSIPFIVLMLLTAGIFQGMGNAKTPMYVTFSMNILNIIFSYLLIFGKFRFPKLGLVGAGISYVTSYILASLLGLFLLIKKNKLFNFKPSFEANLIKRIYFLGTPSSFESISWQVAAIILTRLILSFGETALAAYQVGLQAESISYMPAIGFGVAATSFIGQAIGAKNIEDAKIYFKEILKGSILITSISTILLVFFPKQIMGLLTNSKNIIEIGALYLFIMGLVQVPQNMSMVFLGALRGAGFTQVTMLIALIGLWGIRIPGVILVSKYLKLGIIYIWIVMALDLLVRFILSIILYKSKDIYTKDDKDL
ncbi:MULTISPECIES: MATE family efflux transporter [Caloramator]|uniref:Probable multidrug resistance protein NorM n=1 Tax=Caloramator australicus RC3 TaxID=857293 RepID=I7KSW5_9CLOT|nr:MULTISPECIES: MATE family efflux transporter [Caloramator]MDO6355861.1 MATE family efflux transporter [Caloramator sp. CAR-1]CCJ32753.1 Probable multidrug resistance protein norM (Multidrug-efflux transporter) [Caloramator australicus RC3]